MSENKSKQLYSSFFFHKKLVCRVCSIEILGFICFCLFVCCFFVPNSKLISNSQTPINIRAWPNTERSAIGQYWLIMLANQYFGRALIQSIGLFLNVSSLKACTVCCLIGYDCNVRVRGNTWVDHSVILPTILMFFAKKTKKYIQKYTLIMPISLKC